MNCLISRLLIATIVSGACLLIPSMDTLAQAYPTHPVRLVVPYPPGGPTDILGRILAPKLSEILGEQVFVENRPGGTGVVGATAVKRAPADGYTLMLESIAAVAVNPNFYKSLPYDVRNDYTPIGPVVSSPLFLFVGAAVPARNLQELVALAKSKPGALTFGSAGTGHYSTHIPSEIFKMKNGLDMLHIPYKGTGPAMLDIVAGRISFMISGGLSTAKPFLDSGKLRVFAVTGEKRSAALPEVSTFAEAGYPLPEMNAGLWFAMFGPPRLPSAIGLKLNESIAKALVSPEVRARLGALGLEPMMKSTPEAFTDFMNTEVQTWAEIMKRANITLE